MSYSPAGNQEKLRLITVSTDITKLIDRAATHTLHVCDDEGHLGMAKADDMAEIHAVDPTWRNLH
jgi:hypothetical protein